jgi:hypothetical protein
MSKSWYTKDLNNQNIIINTILIIFEKIVRKKDFKEIKISDWENDRYFPDIIGVRKIVAALGIQIYLN